MAGSGLLDPRERRLDALRHGSGHGQRERQAGRRRLGCELDYLPVENVKLALRRTAYRKFNGGTADYDGFGRNAANNNN